MKASEGGWEGAGGECAGGRQEAMHGAEVGCKQAADECVQE